MPQRFLKPGIRTSKRFNRCDWFSQSLYIRLITLVDDYGRFEVDPELLCVEAFPLGSPSRIFVDQEEISKSLKVLESAKLIQIYTVQDKQYLQMNRWQERARSASRFPAPPSENRRGEALGKVYFVQAVKSGNIKIGFTIGDLAYRLSTLQTGCPEKLVLIHWIYGTKELESEIHEKLKSQRLDGEWFMNSESVRQCIFDSTEEHVLTPDNICLPPSPPPPPATAPSPSPPPPPATSSAGGEVELPAQFPKTVDDAIRQSQTVGVTKDFCLKTWDKAMSRLGHDARGQAIRSWPHYLKSEWNYEQDRIGRNHKTSGDNRTANPRNDGIIRGKSDIAAAAKRRAAAP